MKYEVRFNGSYLNRFEKYSDACDLRDQMKRRFPNADVEIISLD